MTKKKNKKRRSVEKEKDLSVDELKKLILKEAVDLAWLRVTNIGNLRKLALAYESQIKNVKKCNANDDQVKENQQ